MAVVIKYLTGADASNDHDGWYSDSPGSQLFPEGLFLGENEYEYEYDTVITSPEPRPPRLGARVGVGAGAGVGHGVAVGACPTVGVAVGAAPRQSATNDLGRSISTEIGLEKRSKILATSPDQLTNPWRHLACTRAVVPMV